MQCISCVVLYDNVLQYYPYVSLYYNVTQMRIPYSHSYCIQEQLDSDLQQLTKDIWRVGDPNLPECFFGILFDDEQVKGYYEARLLMAAKRRGIVTYDSTLLLKGVHDDVVIKLVGEDVEAAVSWSLICVLFCW